MVSIYASGLLTLMSPYHCSQSLLSEAQWLLTEILLLGGPQARHVFINTSAYIFDKRQPDIATIPFAAFAALASPNLPTATDQYRIALNANQAVSHYLSVNALHGRISAVLPGLSPLLAMWRCQGNDLSVWAVEAAVETAAREWDPDGHEGSPALLHEVGLGSLSRQTNATSAFALRFYSDQLRMLMSAGTLPHSQFYAHTQTLEAIADEALSLASITAVAEGSTSAENWYQCYCISGLHLHFSLPPTFGRAVYESPLPKSWLLNADSTLLLNFRAGIHKVLQPGKWTAPSFNVTGKRTEGDSPPGSGWASIEAAYLSSIRRELDTEAEGGGLVVVDDALDPAAARALHAWLLKTTHWHDARHGYLGTYLDQWSSPAVLRLADELRRALPQLLHNQPLTAAWAYLYDSRPLPENDGSTNGSKSKKYSGRESSDGRANGIPEHADTAAINVNLWLTPDKCATPSHMSKQSGTDNDQGLKKDGDGNANGNYGDNDGGLVVFNHKPPHYWSAETINRRPDLVRNFLYGGDEESDDGDTRSNKKTRGAVQQLRISYRFNRMVIFDSLLFHRTDRHRFTQPGIGCRRINLTLLFGKPANS